MLKNKPQVPTEISVDKCFKLTFSSCRIFAVLLAICSRVWNIFVPSETSGHVVLNKLWMDVCQPLRRHSPWELTNIADSALKFSLSPGH